MNSYHRACAWIGFLLPALFASEMAQALDLESNLLGSARYRYETYDWADKGAIAGDRKSVASTLRLDLTGDFKVSNYAGFLLDFESVQQVGNDDYAVPFSKTQVKANAAPIADPQGDNLNQAYVKFMLPAQTTVKIGTQEIALNDGRFITNSAFRQHHQSFQAATISSAPLQNLRLDLGYLKRVYRVTGDDATNGKADMHSKYFNAGYTVKGVGTFKAYGFLLDFDDEVTNSTDTYGLRYEPMIPLSSSINLIGLLEYAKQKDSGDNPLKINADYIAAEAGIAAGGISYKMGYKVLQGDGTNKFTTPLALPLNGWTELFLVTPNDGMKLWMLSVKGAVPGVKGLSFTTIYYDYKPDTDHGTNLGSEVDLGMEYKPSKQWLTGIRFAKYTADGNSDRFQNALRSSVYVTFNF